MFQLLSLVILVFLNLLSLSNVESLKGVESNEYNLFLKKFANYTKTVRPVTNWNDRLGVDINVKLKKIASVVCFVF